MAKSGRKIGKPNDDRQLSLLDLVRQSQQVLGAATEDSRRTEGSLDVTTRLRLAMVEAIRRCPLSRWEIAGQMSHLCGTEISKFMIDGWTAESKPHYVPAEYLPAFCGATGSLEPLQLLAETAGLFALPGPDALRSEIQHLDEEAKRITAEKRKRILFLKEMEAQGGSKS